jgi:hypothetical protein
MPGKRITELTAIAGASTANDDNLVIFDTSEGTTKRILRSQLGLAIAGDLGGASGTFTSANGKTITVTNGLITAITP